MSYPTVAFARSRTLLVLSLVSGLCAVPAFPQHPAHKRSAAVARRNTGQAKRSAMRQTAIPGRYVMVLADEPVLAQYHTPEEAATPEGKAYRAQIETRQQAMIQTLQARSIRVTSRVSNVLNALFVVAPGHTMEELQSIPGVSSVTPMRRFKAKLDRAVQLVNAPAAWTALGGSANAGAGVKIGILDSGLELTNPMFKDSSLSMPAGFPKCTPTANEYPAGWPYDPTSTADCAFTNSKVIAARSYVRLVAEGSNPSNYATDSQPDDYTPRDRLGHGTAVASVAAGNFVTAPALSSIGGTITLQGMAPKAWIGNYKIAGVVDSADDETMINAVDDAVTDGMDVITTSWGAQALGPASSDPVATAFENAVTKSGLVVLAADGDDGSDSNLEYPTFNTISSPSNAPDVISVGATVNSHAMMPAVSVNASGAPSNLRHIPAMWSDSYFYPSTYGSNVAPLVDVALLDGTGLACVPLAPGSLNGAFALIQVTSSCPVDTDPNGVYDQQALNAQTAGAIGFIWYQSGSTSIYSQPYAEGIYEIGPGVVISNSDGLNLKAYIDANQGASVTIDTAGSEMDLATYSNDVGLSATYNNDYGITPSFTANTLASYSSFGPTPDGQLKPDLVATGGDDSYMWPDPNDTYVSAPGGMYMAGETFDPEGEVYTANGFVAASGTSFSAPLTAGAAALMKQAHPSLNGQQIKSLLVNSASPTAVASDDFGDPVDAEWMGAGLLNAGAAITANVTAVPSSASFGIIKSVPPPIQIALTNIGSGSVSLSSSVSCCSANEGGGAVSSVTLPGATKLTASLSSATLAAGGTSTLTVTLSGTLPVAGEYSGAVILTGSATTLQIPFMFIVPSGVGYNVNVFLGQTCCDSSGNNYYYFAGTPGSDMDASSNASGYPSLTNLSPVSPILQVTDPYGAPVANSSITITASGGLTLQGVSGAPACSPASSTTSITCPTDPYGFLYFDAVLPSSTASSLLTINLSKVVGTSIPVYAFLESAPTLGGVSDTAAGLATIAPGSYASLYGSGFTSNGYADVNTFTNLPLQIDQVTVSFDVGNGATYPGYLVSVSPGQVNVVAPWELQGYSSAQVKVTGDTGFPSNVVTVNIANASPAFFNYNNGTAIATDLSYKLITTTYPAKRGSDIILWANGLGPVTNQPYSGVPAPASGSPLSSTTTLPTITIGGQSATVVYAVLAPGYPGLYQVAVTVPSNAATGSAVPVSLTIGGKTTEGATLPVQ
jgi:uncharacterized protein (TIGR03437 family)